MYNVKENFKNFYKKSDLFCKFCRINLCTQKHVFECDVLKKVIPELVQNENIKYEHIFGTVKEMSNVSKLLITISDERKFMEEMLNPHD